MLSTLHYTLHTSIVCYALTVILIKANDLINFCRLDTLMGFGNIVYWIEMNKTFHMRLQYSMNILIWPIGAENPEEGTKKNRCTYANTHERAHTHSHLHIKCLENNN